MVNPMRNIDLRGLGVMLCLVACRHPSSQAGPPVAAPVSPVTHRAPSVQPTLPLADGRYEFRQSYGNYAVDILEVTGGKPALIPDADASKDAVPLSFVGPGPLWALVDREPGHSGFHANVLVLGDGQAWAYRAKAGGGVRLARMHDVPERLHGRWRVARDTLAGELVAKEISGIELSRASIHFIDARGNAHEPVTLASLSGSADGCYLGIPTEREFFIRMVERDGRLVGSFGGTATVLFSRPKPSPTGTATMARLQRAPVLYLAPIGHDVVWSGLTLSCQDEACEAAPLGQVERKVRLAAAAHGQTAPSLRLQAPAGLLGDDDQREIEITTVGDKLVALGTRQAGPANPVVVTPLSPAELPPDLMGTWQVTVMFPMDGSITGLRVGKTGVQTTHRDGKQNVAFLVRSAFDDSILLLAREPEGDAAEPGILVWTLSRLTRGPEGWYLSRWSDGAGLLLLHQGGAPAFSPHLALRRELADFCDLDKHRKRVAAWPGAPALDPRVPLAAFAESSTGPSRFRHVALRSLFESLLQVMAGDMMMMLGRQLEDYRLPPMACPALDDIAKQLRLRDQRPDRGEDGD